MRLGEALAQRGDLQKRLAQLGVRLRESAVVQEGTEPPEAPEELLGEVDRLADELERLIAVINRTNSDTPAVRSDAHRSACAPGRAGSATRGASSGSGGGRSGSGALRPLGDPDRATDRRGRRTFAAGRPRSRAPRAGHGDPSAELDGGPGKRIERESVAATSSGEHWAATAEVAPWCARGARADGFEPLRTVTPRTVTPAPGTVTTHHRVLSCAARVGQGTFVRVRKRQDAAAAR